MKNIAMKNTEISTKEMNIEELVEVNGGSELSDEVCYYAGRFFGFLSAFGSGAREGSSHRFD